jgi:hypothetical protein
MGEFGSNPLNLWKIHFWEKWSKITFRKTGVSPHMRFGPTFFKGWVDQNV